MAFVPPKRCRDLILKPSSEWTTEDKLFADSIKSINVKSRQSEHDFLDIIPFAFFASTFLGN